MNSKLLYILWKRVSSQIIWYHVCVECVHAWLNMKHCLRECTNRLGPKWCLQRVLCWDMRSERMNWMYQMKCIAYAFCKSKVTYTHTHEHKCSLIFDMCDVINFVRDVIWICKDRISTRISIVLFKHHTSNLGANQVYAYFLRTFYFFKN